MRPPRPDSLQAELEELERTDPAVRTAAEKYDRTVREILAAADDDRRPLHERLAGVVLSAVPARAFGSTDAAYTCDQCGGDAYLCELPDSTCRLKNVAREYFAARDTAVVDDRAIRRLAGVLRAIEDGAQDRLSTARTRQLEILRARVTCLEMAVFDAVAALPPGPVLDALAAAVEGVDLEETIARYHLLSKEETDR